MRCNAEREYMNERKEWRERRMERKRDRKK